MNFQHLKKFIDRMAEERTPGCSVCVYADGKEVYRDSAGVSDLETGTPMTGEEYFNIYSCSKVTTVTAASQLVERGIVMLTDPLYEYIPEYRHVKVRTSDGLVDAKSPILVRDLFCMTAGYDYNLNSAPFRRAAELTDGRMDTDIVTRCLAEEPLFYHPGEKWQYSIAHDLLAGLVSIVTGMKFRDYVRENIFEPLGMTHSYYHADDKIYAEMATQYEFEPDNGAIKDVVEAQKNGTQIGGTFVKKEKDNQFIKGPEYDSGGAGIITTVGDYAKLAGALANGGTLGGERILSPNTIALLSTDHLTDGQRQYFNWRQFKGLGYGLGVHVHIDRTKSGSPAPLGQFGWGGAAGASIFADPTTGIGVFFAQHVLNPREEWYQPRLRNVVWGSL